MATDDEEERPADSGPNNGGPAGEDVLPKPQDEFEIGMPRNMPFATPFQNAWEVLRSEEVTIEKLIAMRVTDGQARALFGLITLPIRSALDGMKFLPEKNVEGGEEEARFIENMFTLPRSAGGMEVPFAKFISQILLAVFDGFAAFEIVYRKPPKFGPMKGKYCIQKMAYRAPETITFLVDDHGNYNGMRQRTNALGKTNDVLLPKDRTFYYAVNEEENPYYGRSLFTAAFFIWDKKVKMEFIMNLAARRAAVGTRVGKTPQGASGPEKIEFKKALANMAVAQHILVPVGYEVVTLQEGNSGLDFLGIVNYYNSQMSKSVLAPFFDQNQGGGQNDTTLVDFGKQSDALFLLMLQTIMNDIAEVINQQVIPRFIDWNFGTGKYPEFHWGELTPDQKQSLRDTFDKIMTGKTTPEFDLALEEERAEDLGLVIDYDALREEMLEKKKQEKAMNDAQMQQGIMGAALGGDPATSQTLNEAQASGATNLPGGGLAPPPTPAQGGVTAAPDVSGADTTAPDSTPSPATDAAPADDGSKPKASGTPVPAGSPRTAPAKNAGPDLIDGPSLGSIPRQYLPEGFKLHAADAKGVTPPEGDSPPKGSAS